MPYSLFSTNVALEAAASRARATISRVRGLRRIVVTSVLACLCLGAMLATPSAARAYGLTGFGGKLGYVAPENLDGTYTLGGHLEFAQHDSRLHLMPSLMLWNTNDLRDVSANGDIYYHFAAEGLVTPYVGAGLGIHFFSNDRSGHSESKLGANLFGGIRLPAQSFRYFFEARYTASDVSQFAVLGGITFPRGGGH